jgi:hypothetical protein
MSKPLDEFGREARRMTGWQPLEGVLGQRSSVRVLRYLVTAGEENSGRGIAAALSMNPWTCHLALRDLTAAGVVTMRVIGNMHLFRLNDESPMVARLLRPLFTEEKLLSEEVWDDLSAAMPATAVGVLAELGGGENGPREVDLLVLVARSADWAGAKRDLESAARELEVRHGMGLTAMVLTVDEFRRRYRSGDARLSRVAGQGRLLKGKSVEALLGGAA